MSKVNRFREAVKESFNVVGLAGAAALSAALLNPLPLLVGLVAEAAYLLFVPDSKWYEARLGKRHEAEIQQRRERLKQQVLPMLTPEMQNRFARLEAARLQIYAQAQGDQQWFDEVLRKLDYLLEKFLLFASKEVQFQSYLRSVQNEVRGSQPCPQKGASPSAAYDLFDDRPRDNRRGGRRVPINVPPPRDKPAPRGPLDEWVEKTVEEIKSHYTKDIAEVTARINDEQDANTKAILEKRKDVLERRHEYIDRIGKILINLNDQLELLEDTFGLINDQIRARSPDQVLSDIEGVVFQTESMTRLLEEIAPFEQMGERLAA